MSRRRIWVVEIGQTSGEASPAHISDRACGDYFARHFADLYSFTAGYSGPIVANPWDPVTQSVRWSKQGGGSTGGGTLTAGNLVFQVLPNGLLRAYSADQGEQVLEIQTNLGSARASDDFYAGWRAVPNIPGQPRRGGGWLWWRRSVAHHSNLLTFVLDGTAPLPEPPPANLQK